jgi:hypothetical protein
MLGILKPTTQTAQLSNPTLLGQTPNKNLKGQV